MTIKDNNEQLNFDLQTKYGPMIGNEDLRRILGFKTMFAFRAAIKRNTVGVNTFSIKGRRGRFAYTNDIEKWLISLNRNEVINAEN